MIVKLLIALQNKNRRILILTFPFFCVACSTFPLSGKIYPPANKTSEQQQTDILTCKAQAKDVASTVSQQAVPSFFGISLIGAYAANEIEKPKQREVFMKCMKERGYSVTPSNDDAPTEDDITS